MSLSISFCLSLCIYIYIHIYMWFMYTVYGDITHYVQWPIHCLLCTEHTKRDPTLLAHASESTSSGTNYTNVFVVWTRRTYSKRTNRTHAANHFRHHSRLYGWYVCVYMCYMLRSVFIWCAVVDAAAVVYLDMPTHMICATTLQWKLTSCHQCP